MPQQNDADSSANVLSRVGPWDNRADSGCVYKRCTCVSTDITCPYL